MSSSGAALGIAGPPQLEQGRAGARPVDALAPHYPELIVMSRSEVDAEAGAAAYWRPSNADARLKRESIRQACRRAGLQVRAGEGPSPSAACVCRPSFAKPPARVHPGSTHSGCTRSTSSAPASSSSADGTRTSSRPRQGTPAATNSADRAATNTRYPSAVQNVGHASIQIVVAGRDTHARHVEVGLFELRAEVGQKFQNQLLRRRMVNKSRLEWTDDSMNSSSGSECCACCGSTGAKASSIN